MGGNNKGVEKKKTYNERLEVHGWGNKKEIQCPRYFRTVTSSVEFLGKGDGLEQKA